MKNFLIIGGSSGIGLELTKMLATQHAVWATYNTKVAQIEGVNFVPYNALNNECIEGLPDTLHGLVYCPGAINLKPFARATTQDFEADYQLQVVGAIKCIQHCLPALKKSGQGSIVLFSTVAVGMGFPFHSIVSSSKGAVEGLTKALAAELAPSIRVNAVAPSITSTPLAQSLLSTPEKVEANAAKHPLKKIGDAATVAAAVAYLLSESSNWTTGQILHIDGGMSAIK